MSYRITVGFNLDLSKLIQIWNLFRLAENIGWNVGSLVGWFVGWFVCLFVCLLVGWLEHLTMFQKSCLMSGKLYLR
jgi:hypothetical protein